MECKTETPKAFVRQDTTRRTIHIRRLQRESGKCTYSLNNELTDSGRGN